LNPSAQEKLRNALQNHPEGRLLSEQRLRELGVWFDDAQYGDLIFLMDSGIQIAPSFMGRKAIAGMHEFQPSDPDSRSIICSKRELPADLTRIQQIFSLMTACAGISR
jgi:hypothetical protein